MGVSFKSLVFGIGFLYYYILDNYVAILEPVFAGIMVSLINKYVINGPCSTWLQQSCFTEEFKEDEDEDVDEKAEDERDQYSSTNTTIIDADIHVHCH